MTIPSLKPAPALPDRTEQDQSVFDPRMAAYWAYLKDDFEPELNSITTAIDSAVTDVNTGASTATTQAGLATTAKTNAETAASEAAASASSALNAPGTSATSTTSMLIATGSKTFEIQTGKAFSIGQSVIIAYTATPANFMIGQITAHNSVTGSMTVDVVATGGSGTQADWTVSLTAPAISDGTITLAKMASGTDGAIITYDASGDPVLIGPGTAGQVPTSQGAGLPMVMGPGGDGTGTLNIQTFTSSGTWTKPANVQNIYVILVGGGGAGGSNNSTAYRGGGGGGGGQVLYGWHSVTGDISVAIGAGGLGGNGDGSKGGNSVLSSGLSLTAYGGGGGYTGTAVDSWYSTTVQGHQGGMGFQGVSSAYETSGSGAGAGGHGLTGLTGDSTQSFLGVINYNTLFNQGGGQAKGESASVNARLAPPTGGVGILGFGGGGGGCAKADTSNPSFGTGYGRDGGGNGGYSSSATDGAANTGGGGGGLWHNAASAVTGKNGGSGICVIYWWEA